MKAFKPRIQVLLVKGVVDEAHARMQTALWVGDVYDLTPHLGDGSSITTNKSIYHPVGGFEIAIPDKPYPTIDSLFGMIDPMDQIIIGLARDVSAYTPEFRSWVKGQVGVGEKWTGLPVVMLGFVRKVVRDEVMGNDGRPRRRVVIRGQDYGCIGEIAQISRLAGLARDIRMLPARFLDTLGFTDTSASASGFIEVIRKNLVKQLSYMRSWMPAIHDIQKDPGVVINGVEHGLVTQGRVELRHLSDHDGTFWSFANRAFDSPWNELFIEDRCDMETGHFGPYLVYRPTPYKAIDSYKYDNDAQFWGGGVVDNMEQKLYAKVVNDSLKPLAGAYQERSDDAVSNVFWVPAQGWEQWGIQTLADHLVTKDTSSTLFDYSRTMLDIYGPRVLMHATVQAATKAETPPMQVDKPRADRAITHFIEWMSKRRQWLKDANKDNVLFTNGMLRIQGNERLRPGCYYRYRRGQMTYTQYVTNVQHSFAPYQHYTTTMQYIRGDNFYQRITAPKPPHLLEGHEGAYT